jgi:hypothetical protein
VLAHCLLAICEKTKAIFLAQAGTCQTFTAINRIATLQNIISHSERESRPLFLLMTDLAKAFDKVAFEGFLDSMRSLGLDESLGSILDNLQNNFECCARTFYGRTSFFSINVGCKQGDGLSPIKFNLWLDMFLQYIEDKKLGYKYIILHVPQDCTQADIDLLQNLAHEQKYLVIGVLGYADDCMFVSDEHAQIIEMAALFDAFLKTYNMFDGQLQQNLPDLQGSR